MTDTQETAGVEPGKEVANIESILKQQLSELKDRVGAPPSNKISTKGKKFTLPDGQSNTTLSAIVLDWRYVLAHYPGVFNPNNPQDPDCFAVGSAKPESGLLKAHSSIEKPHGEDCASCPKNQWKSDANGRGKACKNQIRLMLAGATPDQDTNPLTLYISPTGLKNWFAYLTDLATTHGLDVLQVVTEITFDPNETYPKLQFKMLERHPHLQTAFALRQRYQELVERPIELRGARS